MQSRVPTLSKSLVLPEYQFGCLSHLV